MSFWTFLDKGLSIPRKDNLGQKIVYWIGYKLADRHQKVYLAENCLISPEAKISPRNGLIEIKSDSTVAKDVILQGNVRIGKHCSIQANSVVVGYGDQNNKKGIINIGNYVRIAPQVMMIAANHIYEDPKKPIHEQGLEKASIKIENDVWIAGKVNIMAGVTIGQGSVIGAGAVVTKDIPPYSVAVGVPARVIKERK